MISLVNWSARNVRLSLAWFALVASTGACGSSDNLSPTAEAPVPADAPAAPADSAPAPSDTSLVPDSDSTFPDTAGLTPVGSAIYPGIPFGPLGMRSKYFTTLYRGTKQSHAPPFVMDDLRLAKEKKGRVVIQMSWNGDDQLQNADNTFSYSKWKALVDLYRPLNIKPYITDGTIIGMLLVDEPENTHKWGGKVIPYSTIEAMAKYVKQIWPTMTVFVRAPPTWLAKSSITYTYLDAGWIQYGAYKGNVSTWVAAEVAAAKAKRLGLMAGLNVLDGGNGSSGIRGWLSYRWTMSAAEIKNYGTVILNQPYICGFLTWTYLYQGQDYFNRTTVKTSMTTLSNIAKIRTASCRM
jgi:hypothetical protein